MRRVKLTWAYAYAVGGIGGAMLSVAGISMTDWSFWAVVALIAINAVMVQL